MSDPGSEHKFESGCKLGPDNKSVLEPELKIESESEQEPPEVEPEDEERENLEPEEKDEDEWSTLSKEDSPPGFALK